MVAGPVAVVGSRSLPPGGAALCGRVARSIVASGRALVVGCCVGADEAVLSSVPPSSVRVLCAWGPGGAGSGPASARRVVLAHAAGGGAVAWWAGGGASVPLRSRLVARTRRVAAEGAALAAVFGSPGSRGSLLACRGAVAAGRPVYAFAVGFPAASLPLLGSGRWVAVHGEGVWGSAVRWEPGPDLFA